MWDARATLMASAMLLVAIACVPAAHAATPTAAGQSAATAPQDISVEVDGDTVRLSASGRRVSIKADPATVSRYVSSAMRPQGKAGPATYAVYAMYALLAAAVLSAAFRVVSSAAIAVRRCREAFSRSPGAAEAD